MEVLVGTASIATGTDGIDKVSDLLILVDDTDDESLRRQIIGRILPRGADTDASKKVIYTSSSSDAPGEGAGTPSARQH